MDYSIINMLLFISLQRCLRNRGSWHQDSSHPWWFLVVTGGWHSVSVWTPGLGGGSTASQHWKIPSCLHKLQVRRKQGEIICHNPSDRCSVHFRCSLWLGARMEITSWTLRNCMIPVSAAGSWLELNFLNQHVALELSILMIEFWFLVDFWVYY